MGSLRARFDTLFSWAQARPGWVALALGLMSACGHPPLHGWWIALPALALFVAQLSKAASWRAAAWQGWLFGWAHLTLANNWIATAFTHQAKMPEFLGWLAVPLLCVYLAIYPAAAALVAHLAARKLGVLAFGAIFAAAWIVTEWLRSWVFTGYPWPPLGLVLLGGWNAPGLAYLLPWLGTYALSGFAILVSATLVAQFKSGRWIGVFALSAGIATAMLASHVVVPDRGDTSVRFALVQPLLKQEEINDGSKFEEQFTRIANLTFPGNDQSRLVLWPESAIPDYIEDGYPQRYYDRMTVRNPRTGFGDPQFARRRLGAVIGPRSTLLTGVVNLDIGTQKDGILGAVSARNSVLGLNGAGDITSHYAKAHLVPYGEYLPMRELLEPIGLSRLVAGTIDYREGPGPRTLDLGEHGQAGIQVCYEIVFSGQVVDRENRPDFIFNPSNDGWFGWWGPPQHLAQARMRALEEGLPVLRSTTTGISAVVDADGIVRGTVPTGEAGRIDGFVPKAK
ncbi:MAG: apolipoprotein N-acyltransferase, partial [Erythrobacter sp.]|nr:apolipoprotein N-acyltransferase [Erythrobacter sp.]